MHDLRYAFRSLVRTPGFTLATVATLALGIGSAAAIFSVADRVLFRAPPYPAPEQLAVLGYKTQRFDFLPSRYPIQLAAYREHRTTFRSFAALELSSVNLVVDGAPRGVSLGRVSQDYFSTLGAIPLFGRAFSPGEDPADAAQVVVLSHRFWRERFAADPATVGREVTLDGRLCRIVGVLAKDFAPPPLHGADLYQPLAPTIDPARPLGRYLHVIARLQPGIPPAQAQAVMAAVKVPVSANFARIFDEQKPQAKPLTAFMRPASATAAHGALLGAVAFLYAIACANAANLMLARMLGRRKELCVRLAIGCGRARLMRLVALESMILTVGAGLGGVFVAQWIFPTLLRLAPAGGAGAGSSLGLDWRALAFTAALSVATGLLVSLAPAWRISRANAAEGLKEGGQSIGENRRLRQVRGGLVVVEAALAVALLVGAGLMVRSVQRLHQIDRGFDPANKVAVWLQLPGTSVTNPYRAPEARRLFYQRLEAQLLAVPGVDGVSITGVVPLAGVSTLNVFKPDGTEIFVGPNPVTPGYLRMLGLPLRKGRWFDDASLGGPPVVVINETMARDYFGEANPLGQPFARQTGPRAVPWEVVGIVADVREEARAKPRPQIYYPYWQMPSGEVVSVLLRLRQPADHALGDAVRRGVFAVDPLIAAMPLRPLADAAQNQFAQERHALGVLQVLSGLALVLAVAGLFAVMAYGVSQRMGEFGVRLALGAMPRQLFQLVLRRGLALAATGVAIGIGAAWALTRFLQSLLYETSAHDPLVYAIGAALLLAAATIGCWLPARRATRADVATLLRAE